MEATMGERFVRANGLRASWHSVPVFGRLTVAVSEVCELSFAMVPSDVPIRQGISISVEGGSGIVNGHTGAEFVFWSDSSPEQTILDLTPKRRGARRVHLWNCWEDRWGGPSAMVGNCGMTVDALGTNSAAFQCSSGLGDVDFSDLRVSVSWPDTVQGRVLTPV